MKTERWQVDFGRSSGDTDRVTVEIELGASQLEVIRHAASYVQSGWDLVRATRVAVAKKTSAPVRKGIALS